MKPTRLTFATALIIAMTVALGSCNLAAIFSPGDDTIPNGEGLSGSVDQDTVLSPTGASPDYTVSGDLTVNATLTIEPGVKIAFAENALMTIASTGAIIADGTGSDPIVLTSIDPGAGILWSGLAVESASSLNSLTYVTIENAGGDNDHYLSGWKSVAVSVAESARLSIESSTIDGSGDWGLYSQGTISSFTGNTFENNGGPAVSIHPNDWGAVDSASTFSGNGYDGVVIDAEYNVSESQTVSPLSAGAAYLVDGELSVAAGLTIDPGTTIELDAVGVYGSDYGLITVESAGYLNADGVSGSPIVFTSSDVAGNQLWNGIAFESSSTNNLLDYVEVSYAGRENAHYLSGWRHVAVSVANGARLAITNSTVSNNDFWGVYAHGEITAFDGNSFTGNGGPAVSLNPNDWGVIAGTSSFSGNGHDGIVIDAEFALSSDQSVSALGSGASYFVDGDLDVNAGLTIGAGTTLVFDATGVYGGGFGQLSVGVSGFLNAVGTVSDGIVFTSSDVSGGQHWNGITVDSSSTSNVLDYVEVSYGGRDAEHYVGGWKHANIGIEDDGALTITNSTVSFAQAVSATAYGIALDDLASINGTPGASATISDTPTVSYSNNDADFIVD